MSGDSKGPPPAEQTAAHKVVVRMQDGAVIKGHYADAESIRSLAAVDGFLHRFLQGDRGFVAKEQPNPCELKWPEIKAVFFVSSFEGDRDLEKVHFYGQGPEIRTIWVEVTFHDGEVLEGYMKNALPRLNEGGFFLRPSSPESNNLLVFVNLDAVTQFRVLGVSTTDCS
ncbi:MAG: hypothetical protein P4M01_04530 [Acidobacteriota bacterium]|nr:hypothetical protein [Acidobacteriota bacterium]